MKRISEDQATQHVRDLIEFIGEEAEREGLQKTPKRYIEALREVTSGYNQSLGEIVNDALFPLDPAYERNMIVVRDIQLYSMCEHHLLPFHGTCTIGYIPSDKVLGLSKLARISEMFARRLQIQERLTEEIARAVEQVTAAIGVGVIINAEHMCMSMRGAQKPGAITTTSSLLGVFRTDSRTRQEFLSLVANHRQ